MAQGVLSAHSLHLHVIRDVTCLSVRCLFSFCLLPLSLSLAPLFALHCLLVLCLAHQLPQSRICRGLKPRYSCTMRSIARWRCTTLSQVVSLHDESLLPTESFFTHTRTVTPVHEFCGNQVATWKTKSSGFFLKDKKSKFSLKSDLRSRNTKFKPILIEVSRN